MPDTISSVPSVEYDQRDLLFVGDIHGSYSVLQRLTEIVEDTVIFQVGDFGAGFLHPNSFAVEMNHLAQCAARGGNVIVAIRGNHDEPCYFDDRHYSNRVRLLRDNQIVEVAGHKLFVAGGAVSVDRTNREVGKSWWRNEQCRVDFAAVEQLRGITGVVTHTCPYSFPCIEFGGKSSLVDYYAGVDSDLRKDLLDEQLLLQKLYDQITKNNKLQFWVHGHFHEAGIKGGYSSSVDNKGIDRRLLSINESWSPTVWNFASESPLNTTQFQRPANHHQTKRID